MAERIEVNGKTYDIDDIDDLEVLAEIANKELGSEFALEIMKLIRISDKFKESERVYKELWQENQDTRMELYDLRMSIRRVRGSLHNTRYHLPEEKQTGYLSLLDQFVPLAEKGDY